MTAKVFVDTNVLVYWRDASEPDKQARALAWMETLWERRTGRLSFQVLQEFYVTVTAKLDPGLTPELARLDVGHLMSWKPVGWPAAGRSLAVPGPLSAPLVGLPHSSGGPGE
jgi:predicted nucleic acid-binding protein